MNPADLSTVLNSAGLRIVEEYYSSLDNFDKFKVSQKSDLFRENSSTIYNLEKALNVEYQKEFTLTQRSGMHGLLWNVMGTRNIKIKHATR